MVEEASEEDGFEVFWSDVLSSLGHLVEVVAAVVAELDSEDAENFVVALGSELAAEEDVVADGLADEQVHLGGIEV